MFSVWSSIYNSAVVLFTAGELETWSTSTRLKCVAQEDVVVRPHNVVPTIVDKIPVMAVMAVMT